MNRRLSMLALLGFLTLGACAQKGENKTNSMGSQMLSWDRLVGVLFVDNQPRCTVSFMGGLLAFTARANSSEQIAFAATASHCVERTMQQQSANPGMTVPMKILWSGGAETPVADFEKTSGQTSYFGDFALLRIPPPLGYPYLLSNDMDVPQVGMAVTVLGVQMMAGQVVTQPIKCTVSVVLQNQYGFELSDCFEPVMAQDEPARPLSPEAAPGLSGALIVNNANNRLVGVWKSSLPGALANASYRFTAGALAWIPESRESFGLPQQPSANGVANSGIPYKLCSDSLKGECLAYAGQELMLRQCASAWVAKKTVLGMGSVLANGEVCRLSPVDSSFIINVRRLLSENNGSIGGSTGGYGGGGNW
jgi:hypothetical protein